MSYIKYQISNMLPESCLLAWSFGWGFADKKNIHNLWSVSH